MHSHPFLPRQTCCRPRLLKVDVALTIELRKSRDRVSSFRPRLSSSTDASLWWVTGRATPLSATLEEVEIKVADAAGELEPEAVATDAGVDAVVEELLRVAVDLGGESASR